MSAIAVQPRFGVRTERTVVRAGTIARPGGDVRTVRHPRSDGPAGTAGAAPLRLTRRGRVVVVLLGLLVVVGGALGGRAVADGPERGTEVTTHAVQAGETLWQIAAGIAGPGEDVRDVVDRLQDLNGLASASLVAGDVLLIPVAS
jgi:nucleoid-associated protein YgaU